MPARRRSRELGPFCAIMRNGAGDEIRTRDINLGKVALYQLSYSRAELAKDDSQNAKPNLSIVPESRSTVNRIDPIETIIVIIFHRNLLRFCCLMLDCQTRERGVVAPPVEGIGWTSHRAFTPKCLD